MMLDLHETDLTAVIYPLYNSLERNSLLSTEVCRFIWKLNWNETEMLSISPNRLSTFSKWTNLFSMVLLLLSCTPCHTNPTILIHKKAKMCKQRVHITKMRLPCCIMHSHRQCGCVRMWLPYTQQLCNKRNVKSRPLFPAEMILCGVTKVQFLLILLDVWCATVLFAQCVNFCTHSLYLCKQILDFRYMFTFCWAWVNFTLTLFCRCVGKINLCHVNEAKRREVEL